MKKWDFDMTASQTSFFRLLVMSIPNLQLMSTVWRKLKVDSHTRTKVIPLQIVRFRNINCIKKTETVKANSL